MKDMTPEHLNQLLGLLGALRDEVITADEFSELNGMLEKYRTAREYYLDYTDLCRDLSDLHVSIQRHNYMPQNTADTQGYPNLLTPPITMDMLQAWAEYEKTAEAVEVPQPKENETESVLSRIPVMTPPRKVSKFSLVTVVTSVAAMLLMLTYVILNPRTEFEVATLTDAVNAQWSHYQTPVKGTRLTVSAAHPIQLHRGVVKIESDKGVIVTLEGPAVFRFISPDEIVMDYGRLFAVVPQSGTGFSVQTQNSKIIDLGTTFGVYAETRGKTELHVFKGKTILIAGQKDQEKTTIEVSGGQARRIDSNNSHVTDIVLNHNMFTQGIDSKAGLLITGGKQIDLADIVGGGTGTGDGNKNCGIQWDGGKLLSNANLMVNDPGAFPEKYVPVNCNPLIDGIFVPNCKGEEPLMLTSSITTLNLNDFIASDTNGLLTLILLHETSDLNAAYLFNSKEKSENNPAKYPTLAFPNASSQGPVKITTADDKGADTYVANDFLRASRHVMGEEGTLWCRYINGENKRIRIIFLRFDISSIKGNDLTNAVLSLYLNSGNRARDLNVYGLKDGPADSWDESTISYDTAPGLLPAELGNFRLDETALSFLGTFHVVDNRISTAPIQVAADATYRWSAPHTQCQSAFVISNAAGCLGQNGSEQAFMLDNIPCGTDRNPSIFMPANAGITFDLEAIRRVYGPVSIESFTAACGISNPGLTASNNTLQPAASFYVLVDGQEVFGVIDMTPEDPPQSIEIKLSRQARYLTLVATQGTDNSVTNDFCLFAKPMLTLQ